MHIESESVISVKNVSKSYVVWDRPYLKLLSLLSKLTLRKIYGLSKIDKWVHAKLSSHRKHFQALTNINFEIKRGESVGILGLNGSGKSTLLQIIAGTLTATQGEVHVTGRIAALLELGSGFNPEFTGRENVYLNAAILGVKRKEIEKKIDEIESFADIGEYIDQPVKTYSSGMLVRLAFSVQVQLKPDILIIDEALAVGDVLFQKRCFQHLDKLIKSGVTLLFVSHSQEAVRTLTKRAVLLRSGRLRAIGDSADIVREYQRQVHGEEEAYLKYVNNKLKPGGIGRSISENSSEVKALSFGSGELEIESVTLLNSTRDGGSVFFPDETIRIEISCVAKSSLRNLNVGVRIRNREGIKVYSWGTLNQDMEISMGRIDGEIFWDREFEIGDRFVVAFEAKCNLGKNFYEIQAIATIEETLYYGNQRVLHWLDEAAFFQVQLLEREYFFGGTVDMRMKADFQR